MRNTAFLDEMDEFDTVLKGCKAKGDTRVVIAIGDQARDRKPAEDYVARHDVDDMDVIIRVLPNLESGELWNGRRVIRYRFL